MNDETGLVSDLKPPLHRPPHTYRLAKRIVYACLSPLYLAKTDVRLFDMGYLIFGAEAAALAAVLWITNPLGLWAILSENLPHILRSVLWLVGKPDPPPLDL